MKVCVGAGWAIGGAGGSGGAVVGRVVVQGRVCRVGVDRSEG